MLTSSLKDVQREAWEGKDVKQGTSKMTKMNQSIQDNGYLFPSLSSNGYFDPRAVSILNNTENINDNKNSNSFNAQIQNKGYLKPSLSMNG